MKTCENCLKNADTYITCFKCNAIYHDYCWKEVPGAYVNQTGQLFCCRDLTSNYAGTHANLGTQDNPPEKVMEKGNVVDSYNKDLDNCLIKEEDPEWNEFNWDNCPLEFINKGQPENHYSEYPNKDPEFIEELKEDKDCENHLIKEENPDWNEYKCDSCRLEFTNKGDLENHYSKCPNKEGQVIQELKEDKDLKNCLHKEEDLEWNEFKCGGCLLEFTNKEHLENHYNECPNKEGEFVQELKEDKAGLFYLFFNEENVQKEPCEQHIKRCQVESSSSHVSVEHSYAEKIYKCGDCEFSTHLKKNLSGHIRNHTSEKKFKCDKCDYAAAFKSNLNAHVLVKHSNAEKMYKCSDCEYSGYRRKHLLEHARTHTNERPFKCDMCDYAAKQQTSLKRHILRKHSNAEKMYKCDDCEFSSYTKNELLEHKRTHTDERPFRCDMCDYATNRKPSLKAHILKKHSNAEKMYKCGDCEYSSYTKKQLLIHKRTHHDKEKPFKCDMCNYAAAQKNTLNAHVLVKHSNADKKYKCRDCEYSTHMKANLVYHIRTHTNEKPFKCDTCDYTAASNAALKMHTLVKHSNGEKIYMCEDCEFSSYNKNQLLEHKLIHTNE